MLFGTMVGAMLKQKAEASRLCMTGVPRIKARTSFFDDEPRKALGN